MPSSQPTTTPKAVIKLTVATVRRGAKQGAVSGHSQAGHPEESPPVKSFAKNEVAVFPRERYPHSRLRSSKIDVQSDIGRDTQAQKEARAKRDYGMIC